MIQCNTCRDRYKPWVLTQYKVEEPYAELWGTVKSLVMTLTLKLEVRLTHLKRQLGTDNGWYFTLG